MFLSFLHSIVLSFRFLQKREGASPPIKTLTFLETLSGGLRRSAVV
jgi:hypothetical protein